MKSPEISTLAAAQAPPSTELAASVVPTLEDLRKLHGFAYLRYQMNKNEPVLPDIRTDNSVFIYADPTPFTFNLETNDRRMHYTDAQKAELARLAQLCAGYFQVETVSLPHQLPEAADLFKWDGWSRAARIDYLGGFSPHPGLSNDVKLFVLCQLFKKLKARQLKYPPQFTLIVLAPHVKQFVEATKMIQLTEVAAQLNTESPTVQSLQNTFPGYWKRNPLLYQLTFLE